VAINALLLFNTMMKKRLISALMAFLGLLLLMGAFIFVFKKVGFSILAPHVGTNGILLGIFIIGIIIALVLFQEILKLKIQLHLVGKNLREQIRESVESKFIEVSPNAKEMTELAVEIWRIEQRISKSASSLAENQIKGLENSIQKLKRYLEKYDFEIIDYKNQKFNEGLNLEILSVEKDPELLEPIVKETVEPTIMCKGQVVRKAKIILLTNK